MSFRLSEEVVKSWTKPLNELPDMLEFSHMPTGDGMHHTSFMIVPDGPHAIAAFPHDNFLLLAPGLQKDIKDAFAQYGLVLAEQ